LCQRIAARGAVAPNRAAIADQKEILFLTPVARTVESCGSEACFDRKEHKRIPLE